ncbi:PaaI family thioesterase [Paraburkholderia phymatum]|uniref:PaaI family thioesterase n=1 Tax=Paraburkholderia phymatum TaxID=148447 RepID=A0ACC6UBS5_9BURK
MNSLAESTMSEPLSSQPIKTGPGRWSPGEIEQMPLRGFQRALGITLDMVSPNHICAHIAVGEQHVNSGGVVHGGVLMALADSLGAMGALQNLRPSQRTATLESKTNFVRPCCGTRISAECTAVHIGRQTSVWQTVLSDERGAPCAYVTQTQLHIEVDS